LQVHTAAKRTSQVVLSVQALQVLHPHLAILEQQRDACARVCHHLTVHHQPHIYHLHECAFNPPLYSLLSHCFSWSYPDSAMLAFITELGGC
jgi:hypothetical protein